MKAIKELKRREFLRATTGAVGWVSLWHVFHSKESFAAESAGKPPAKNKEALDKLMGEMEGKGRRFLSVPRKDGQFLNLLVKATRARNALEVGTSHGYSAIWIGLGLEETGGHLTTIEIESDRAKLANEHLAHAGLSHRVTVKEGDAHKVVPTLEGPFDFVFLDADKEGQMDYFNKLYPKKLSPGGILTVHNSIRQRAAMREFLEMLAGHPDFDSVILSLTMEDGFSVSCRHRQ